MSKIDKLSIMGVRSFAPSRPEAIQFSGPLTLIVGYNGSGKTTIIECLKYATTGELPPNSKGGAFIHDPKLCGEKEIKAQVRLSFNTTLGERYVATRALQLTVKKTARSQKTLEGSLMWINNGERHAMSHKTADMDAAIPEKLGVSPAILDAVIFCHQDESLWPLSEPAALKKRFDEIFEALRYTKAVDNLKVVKKKQGEELAKAKLREAQDKISKEKGERTEKLAKTISAEIDGLRVRVEEKLAEMERVQETITDKHTQAHRFLGIVQELKNKQDQYDYRKTTADELRDVIDEIHEPDDWLQTNLEQYQDRVDRIKADIEQGTVRYNDLSGEIKRSRQALSAKQAERGKHESDKDKYERQLQTRVAMVRGAAARHEIRGYDDGDLDDGRVQAFNERIQKVLDDKRRELDRLRRDNAGEVDKAAQGIQGLETRKASSTQDRVSAKRRIAEIESRTKKLQTELSGLRFDEGAQAVHEAELEELEERLQRAKDEFAGSNWDGLLAEDQARLQQHEGERERLGRELVECTRLASERAQLDLRKRELTERQRKLDTLTSTWQDKLTEIIGSAWQPSTLESAFLGVMQRHDAACSDSRKRVDSAQQDLKQVEYSLASARDRQRKLSAESDRCRGRVLDALGKVKEPGTEAAVEDYLEALSSVEEDMLGIEKDINLYDELKQYYEKSQRALDRYNKCSLCERGFDGHEQAKSKLLKKIADNLSDKEKKELEAEKQSLQAKLRPLQAARSHHDTYRRVETELPTVLEEITALESRKDAVVRQLEQQDALMKEAEEARQDVEAMNKTVLGLTQAFKDISDSERQIERLSSQQSSTGIIRSADEIHERQSACAEQMRALNAKIAKMTNDRQRMRESVSALELERAGLKNTISEAMREYARKTDLQGQVQTLKDDQNAQREAIRQADGDLESLEPEIAKARAIRDDILERGRAKEQRAGEERDAVAHTVSELRMIEGDVRDYVDRGGPSNLAANQRAIQTLEQTIADLDKEMADLTVQINKKRQETADSDRQRKNMQDNLSYRRTLRVLDTLGREVDELKSLNAEEDHDRYLREAQAHEVRYSKLLTERSSMLGTMNTKDQELARLLGEWDLEYKDAARKYRESHIRVETTKAAIEDLGRYMGALDRAVMQYHTLKMEEVNRIAGELWQSTYQGTDIDTIMIRSDHESSTGRRTYNYRLCMVKQDTEMDMRGRCSAGQKVLASIVIRLALAESFGVNCGLIALDEPTTNLDSDNIRSLAVSLHAIIQQRRAQANFQLIVITHDEEFLRHMQCSDFCDTFYRVKRDERQNSVIVKESITKVME